MKLNDIQSILFREAKITQSLLFLDECETLFETRNRSKNASVNIALSMIERYDGIMVLATNRSYDLDEAMHRRIQCSVEFTPPDVHSRLYISRRHIPQATILNSESDHSGVILDSTVDFEVLSTRFELTGGFIKNAMNSALKIAALRRRRLIDEKAKIAIGSDDTGAASDDIEMSDLTVLAEEADEAGVGAEPDSSSLESKLPIIITQNDLVTACIEQMKHVLELTLPGASARRILPTVRYASSHLNKQ